MNIGGVHRYSAITPIYDYEEDVLQTDPFKARFTFTIEDDALQVTVDDDLNVIAVDHRRSPPET